MAKLIMTADDSASVRQIVAFTLKQTGYDVVEAVDGRDALNKLNAQKVDMLLTDLNMPNMDGIGLIKGVRAGTLNKFILAIDRLDYVIAVLFKGKCHHLPDTGRIIGRHD